MPMAQRSLTYARLRERLSYDPLTGLFRWLVGGHGRTVGQVAGSALKTGRREYIEIGIDGQRLYAHTLAVFYMTGEWPRASVGFVDGDGLNLVFSNLECCSPAELQRRNLSPIRGNTTGFRGVSAVTGKPGRFVAKIKVNGIRIFLGEYSVAKDAYADYLAARELMYGVATPDQTAMASA